MIGEKQLYKEIYFFLSLKVFLNFNLPSLELLANIEDCSLFEETLKMQSCRLSKYLNPITILVWDL